MTLQVKTISGTKAGIRKPFNNEQPGAWQCKCDAEYEVFNGPAGGPVEKIGEGSFKKYNPGYMVNCPDCWARRDGK